MPEAITPLTKKSNTKQAQMKNTTNKQQHTRLAPKTKSFVFRYQNWLQVISKLFDDFALFYIFVTCLSKGIQKVEPQFLIV